MDEPALPAVTAPVGSPGARTLTTGLIIASLAAVHAVTLAGGFVYDDLWVVVNNPFLKDAANFARLLTGDLPAGLADANRPFAVALYMLDYALFGLEPWGWHLHNLLWHLACALSLAWLARQLSGDERIARAAGLLFAVHALLTEAVAVVNYREDLVATSAVVIAMGLVVHSRRSGSWLPVPLACLALLCGTNAKEIVPVFPILLAAYDACFSRADLKRFLGRCGWTYLPLTIAAFGSRFWIDALLSPSVLQTAHGAEALTLSARIATSAKITLAYLGQLALPIHLSSDYPSVVAEGLSAASLLGLLAVVSLLGIAGWNLRRRPVLAFGLLWLLVALIPTSGVAPIQNLRADRYLYLPGVGYALAAGWALVSSAERAGQRLRSPRVGRQVLPAALALACGVYGGLAFARNQVWSDELTLWEHTLRQHPHSRRAQLGLMSEYLRRDRLEDARRVGDAASIDHPESWQLQLNLGQILDAQGRPRQALRAYERAVVLGGGGDPRLIDNTAIAHLHAGDLESALDLLRDGVARAPRDARMQLHLGQVAFERGDFSLAARALEAATRLEPADLKAYLTLARSQLRLGAVSAAREAVDHALALAPEHPAARSLSARISRRSAARNATPAGNHEVSPSEIDRLRALGYADFSDATASAAEDAVSEFDPERSAPGYNLIVTRSHSLAELIDPRGKVVKSWRDPEGVAWSNAELTPVGHLLVQGVRGRKRLYLTKLGWNGRVLWRRWIKAHHDAELTPDGRIAVLTLEGRQRAEIHPSLPLLDNDITLLDGQGHRLESHSLYQMLRANPEVFRFQDVAPTDKAVDLLHANSIEFMRHPHLEGRDPIYARGNAIVSFRHQDTAAIFDLEAKRVVWAWGQGEVSGPHDATVLENGNVLLFDNGLGRGWSRVLELDPLRREIVWQYRAPRPDSFYTASEGSNQRLPNGNTLIGNSVGGEAFEVTAQGDVVWRWRNPNGDEDGRRASIVRIKRYPEDPIEARLHAAEAARP